MSSNQSWKNWVIVIGLLIVFGLVTALWSAFTSTINLPELGFGGSTTAVPVEIEPIHLEIPLVELPGIGSVGGQSLEFSPFVGLAALAAIIIGGIVVVGGGIAFLIKLLSGIHENTTETQAYQESVNRLENQQKEKLKAMKEGRDPNSKPEHVMPRWSTISTSLIVLMFVWFGGMVINGELFPEGEFLLENGTLIHTTPIVVGLMLLIALIVLIIRARPQRILSAANDYGAIPWDTIAVLITGLVVVGLGLGAMWYFIGPVS